MSIGKAQTTLALPEPDVLSATDPMTSGPSGASPTGRAVPEPAIGPSALESDSNCSVTGHEPSLAIVGSASGRSRSAAGSGGSGSIEPTTVVSTAVVAVDDCGCSPESVVSMTGTLSYGV